MTHRDEIADLLHEQDRPELYARPAGLDDEIAAIFDEIARDQRPLGAEFEAAMVGQENLLYSNEPLHPVEPLLARLWTPLVLAVLGCCCSIAAGVAIGMLAGVGR